MVEGDQCSFYRDLDEPGCSYKHYRARMSNQECLMLTYRMLPRATLIRLAYRTVR